MCTLNSIVHTELLNFWHSELISKVQTDMLPIGHTELDCGLDTELNGEMNTYLISIVPLEIMSRGMFSFFCGIKFKMKTTVCVDNLFLKPDLR